MKTPIAGGIILITGASSGLGLSFAHQLAPEAKTLLLVARRQARLEALKADLIAKYPHLLVDILCCDLADDGARTQLIDGVLAQYGKVDILINNAGMGSSALFEATDYGHIDGMLKVNIQALTHLTHAFIGPMLAAKSGGILNISSGFGLAWVPLFAAYGGSKQYVTAFTEALRCEVRSMGVVVSQVCPGPIATEFEAIAGAPAGMPLPGWLMQSADDCVRQSLHGFKKGRALIIPGLMMKVAALLDALSPRFLKRLIYGPMGGLERRRLLSQGQRDATEEST